MTITQDSPLSIQERIAELTRQALDTERWNRMGQKGARVLFAVQRELRYLQKIA